MQSLLVFVFVESLLVAKVDDDGHTLFAVLNFVLQ